MIGKITLYSILLIGVLTFAGVFISVQHSPLLPTPHIEAAVGIVPDNLTTETWGLFDPRTGTIIAGRNTDVQKPIASISKLFTAVAVEMSPQKNDSFIVSSDDVRTEGRSGKLIAGESVTPYQLLFPSLIESSNDAAKATERFLGDAYTDSVQNIQNSVGLTHTDIHDASGLSAKNVSTVSDLALFFSYIKKTHPHILDITQLQTYIDTRTGYINNNPAQALPSFTGGKHGYTQEANRTFVGTFTVGKSTDEVGIVLLGSDALVSDIQALLLYSESFKRTSDIIAQ